MKPIRYALLAIGPLICGCGSPAAEPPEVIGSIYWSDGDSGRIDGEKFRLANIDAPETGGIGARGGAKCERERELGYLAKEFVVELTKDATIIVTSRNGADRYGREVITLSVDGVDIAKSGIDAGHLEPWPHRGRKALSKKPNWCD